VTGSLDNRPHLVIVAMLNGEPVEVLTNGHAAFWRTTSGARRMVDKLTEELPEGSHTTYHIVRAGRA
jgi:hypothetical protein